MPYYIYFYLVTRLSYECYSFRSLYFNENIFDKCFHNYSSFTNYIILFLKTNYIIFHRSFFLRLCYMKIQFHGQKGIFTHLYFLRWINFCILICIYVFIKKKNIRTWSNIWLFYSISLCMSLSSHAHDTLIYIIMINILKFGNWNFVISHPESWHRS